MKQRWTFLYLTSTIKEESTIHYRQYIRVSSQDSSRPSLLKNLTRLSPLLQNDRYFRCGVRIGLVNLANISNERMFRKIIRYLCNSRQRDFKLRIQLFRH